MTDIDECQDPNRCFFNSNTTRGGGSQERCVNTIGSFYCLPAGIKPPTKDITIGKQLVLSFILCLGDHFVLPSLGLLLVNKSYHTFW